MVEFFKSVTDSRAVIDVVAPGYSKDMVTVKTAKVDGGKHFIVKVEGTYARPTGATGKLVPRFAFDKTVDDSFKVKIDSESIGADLDTGDFDVDKTAYTVKNGVIRISIPKSAAAAGTKLEATDGNIDAVDATDTAADGANA